MQTGDRLADRWELGERVATTDGTERWRALDERTGEAVELLVLGPARSSASERRSFHDVHRSLESRPETASTVATLAVHHDETRAYVVRTPLADATLADVRAPLDAAVVAAIGVRMLPAVSESGAATRGALLPSDIGLDEAGQPVLAPRGAPMNQVVRGTTKAVAPEVYTGRAPDGAAGLYGLGTLLYRLSTGREPPIVVGGAPPAPPSAVRHGIDPAFDEAVSRLLDANPARRASALPLLTEVAGDRAIPDLREQVRPAAVVGEVTLDRSGGPTIRTTTSADRARSGRASEPPRALVIVPHRVLAGLDPADRHAAAGLAGVSLSVIDEAIAKRLPLVIEGFSLRADAARKAREWSASTGLRLTAGVAGTGQALWLPLLAALVLGLPLGLLTLVLTAFQVWVVAVPAAALFAVDAGFALLTWLWMRNLAADWTVANDAWQLVQGHRAQVRELGLEPVHRDLASLRRQLATTELPVTAASDLRSVLKEVDSKLVALQDRASTSAEALQKVDATGLRARLGVLNGQPVLDPAQIAERDRLTRTVADLEDVEALRQSVRDEAHRLRDALAEVAAVLGRISDDATEDALAALGRGARHVGETARSAEGADDERLRRARALTAAKDRAAQ